MKKQKDKDFADELEILTHGDGPEFPPAPPSETIDVAGILAQSYFDDHGWPLIRLLNWIAWRDVARIGDSSWNGLNHRIYEDDLATIEHNPPRRLLEALQAGKITAAMPGKEISLRDWDTIQPSQLERDFGATTYLRDDVLREWKPKGAPPSRKGGRRPSIDWTVIDHEVARLMDYHGPFSIDDPKWNCPARLEETITKFIEKKFGEGSVKSESTVRTRTTEAIEKWRKPRADN